MYYKKVNVKYLLWWRKNSFKKVFGMKLLVGIRDTKIYFSKTEPNTTFNASIRYSFPDFVFNFLHTFFSFSHKQSISK